MLSVIKDNLRRCPNIKKAHESLSWKRHACSDWLHTYILKKQSGMIPNVLLIISNFYIANRSMTKGIFEKDEIELIQKNILNADMFVDVGANIGFYMCLARYLGKYVVAIEPQPQNLNCLYAN
jgi:hypothetical protein